jgi:hypothetical protein
MFHDVLKARNSNTKIHYLLTQNTQIYSKNKVVFAILREVYLFCFFKSRIIVKYAKSTIAIWL